MSSEPDVARPLMVIPSTVLSPQTKKKKKNPLNFNGTSHCRASRWLTGKKNSPAKQERWVQSGQEDPLEEERATHSNIFAWRIPWTEDPGGL